MISTALSKLGIPSLFGMAVAVGTAMQQPDWTMVAVVGGSVFWLNQRFNKIDRRIDALPCRHGKINCEECKEEI